MHYSADPSPTTLAGLHGSSLWPRFVCIVPGCPGTLDRRPPHGRDPGWVRGSISDRSKRWGSAARSSCFRRLIHQPDSRAGVSDWRSNPSRVGSILLEPGVSGSGRKCSSPFGHLPGRSIRPSQPGWSFRTSVQQRFSHLQGHASHHGSQTTGFPEPGSLSLIHGIGDRPEFNL
jgi:hypothetical protein